MMRRFEGWHLHHLARRARVFGIDKPLVDTLERIGWQLTKGKPITDDPRLEKALLRLASIKDFERTCDEPNCPICQTVVTQYSKNFTHAGAWRLDLELYRWQKEAKEEWWKNNGRGIVKVVTGAGKTILALSIISDLHMSEAYRDGGLRVIAVVPTVVLSDQWLAAFTSILNVPRDEIAVQCGREKDPIAERKILIYVVNSARDYLTEHARKYFWGEDIFLIADECHRYGSKENSRIFELAYSYTLGLSATPERFGDFGFEQKLVPNLGTVIYSYSYSDALRDGIIPPYKLIRLRVSLRREELSRYEDLSDRIARITRVLFSRYPELRDCGQYEFLKRLGHVFERTGDTTITSYTSLLNQRKGIIHTSESKLNALKWLIDNEDIRTAKVLLFHERIEIANRIFKFLKERGYRVGIYHTGFSTNQRIQTIADYRSGVINILVSCHALDEGFDVPQSEVGIIVAGTSSVRQWIQRMGRILRRTPGKEYSRIFVVFANVVEQDVFAQAELSEFESEAASVELIDLAYSRIQAGN